MASSKKIALKIVKNSPVAISSAIRAVNAGYTDGVNGFETEIEEFGKCFEYYSSKILSNIHYNV